MGNTERIKKLLAEAKAKPKPAAPPKGKGGPKGKPKKKGRGGEPFAPPAVRENDKKLLGKPRLPPSVLVEGFWDGQRWGLGMKGHGVSVGLTSDKLFAGLHALDDLFRAELAKRPGEGGGG